MRAELDLRGATRRVARRPRARVGPVLLALSLAGAAAASAAPAERSGPGSAASANLGAGATFASNGTAHAPTVWERAADPARGTAEHVHRSVEKLLAEAEALRWHTPMAEERLTLALHLLEGADAIDSADLRLRFDLGRVLSLLGEDERAAAALENSLRTAPDDPQAADAYFKLAVSYARLGRPSEEIAAYDEYLRRETNPVDRAIALSNRAESRMVEGDLTQAVVDYRASIALSADNVLAHWGLAVALDRTGDRAGGLNEAKIAIGYDPLDQLLGDRSTVFFVPPYDRYWYEGLGAMARAEMIDDPGTSILWWETAMAKWSEYAAAASEHDRWVPLAKQHKTQCGRALADARKKSGKK
jgi:tetratricopeptide (TPR) repeat protein